MLTLVNALKRISRFFMITLCFNTIIKAQDTRLIKTLKQTCIETILNHEINIQTLPEYIKEKVQNTAQSLYEDERNRVMNVLHENNILLPKVDVTHGVKTLYIVQPENQTCCSRILQTGLKYNINFTRLNVILTCMLASSSLACFATGWTFGCCLFTNPKTCCLGVTTIGISTCCSGGLILPCTREFEPYFKEKYYHCLLPEMTQENVSEMPPQTISMEDMDPLLLIKDADSPAKEHSDSDEEMSENEENEENWLLQD